MKANGFTLKRPEAEGYLVEIINGTDDTDDPELLANTLAQFESMQHSLEQAARGIDLNVNI